jgi:hypothetical protein
MTDRERYAPGPARGAEVLKDGGKWTLILAGELRHWAPATHALLDRDMFKRLANVRSLYG